MNTTRLSRLATGLLLLFVAVQPALAVFMVSVDMDLGTPGIQSTRAVAPNDTFQIGLVMTVDAAGVSSYGISVLFNNTELSLDGAPASTELLPVGMDFNFTAGVQSESQALGQVYTFEAATFGAGPSSTSFTIGTINFMVPGAATIPNDAVADITVGFFNVGVDGLFDNAGNPVVPAFNGGFLTSTSTSTVPDSGSTWALLAIGLGGLWAARTKLKSHTHPA